MESQKLPELYVGIDPDLHGAIVVLDKVGEIRTITRLPLMKEDRKAKGKIVDGKRIPGKHYNANVRDWDGLRMFLAGLGNHAGNVPMAFAIEKQLGFTAQSIASTLIPYGKIVGMMMAFNLRPIEVPIQTWQASCLPKKPKGSTTPRPKNETPAERNKRLEANRKERKQLLVQIATGIWPSYGHAGEFNSGEADAALIARWCWMKFRMQPLSAKELLDVSEGRDA